MIKIAVFASGGGSNLQALLDAQNAGLFKGKIGLVFSNVPGCGALEKAENERVEAISIASIVPSGNFPVRANSRYAFGVMYTLWYIWPIPPDGACVCAGGFAA